MPIQPRLPLLIIFTLLNASCSIRDKINSSSLHPQKLYTYIPDSLGIDYDTLWIPFGETKLHAWYIQNKGSKNVIIIVNGNTRNKSKYLLWAKLIHEINMSEENGYNILMFDYPGFGQSTGIADIYNTVSATKAVISFVKDTLIEEAKIGLVGISLGATISIAAASTSPEVKAIWAEGAFIPYDKFKELTGSFLGWFLAPFSIPDEWGIEHLIKSLNTPVYFTVGSDDTTTPPIQTARLYLNKPLPKFMWIVNNAPHAYLLQHDPIEYTKQFSGFFKAYLNTNEGLSSPEFDTVIEKTDETMNLTVIPRDDKIIISVILEDGRGLSQRIGNEDKLITQITSLPYATSSIFSFEKSQPPPAPGIYTDFHLKLETKHDKTGGNVMITNLEEAIMDLKQYLTTDASEITSLLPHAESLFQMAGQSIEEKKVEDSLFIFEVMLRLKNLFHKEIALINNEELVLNFKLLHLLTSLYEHNIISSLRYTSHKNDISRTLDRYVSGNFLGSREELLDLVNEYVN